MGARVSFCVFGAQLPVGGAVASECLQLLCQYINANFTFFHTLAIPLYSEIAIVMINWQLDFV